MKIEDFKKFSRPLLAEAIAAMTCRWCRVAESTGIIKKLDGETAALRCENCKRQVYDDHGDQLAHYPPPPMSNTTPERTPEQFADEYVQNNGIHELSDIDTLTALFAQAIEQGRQAGLRLGYKQGARAGMMQANEMAKDDPALILRLPGDPSDYVPNPYRTSTTTPIDAKE